MRWRRWLKWCALAMLLLAISIGSGLVWLLHSNGGRDFALQKIVAALPPGSTLSWKQARGSLLGSLALQNVHVSLPMQRNSDCVARPNTPCDMGTLSADIDELSVDVKMLPLFLRRIQLGSLRLRNITLDLPHSDTPFKFPQWPDVLPTLALPVSIYADAIAVEHFQLLQEQQHQLTVHQLRGSIRLGNGWLELAQLELDSDRGALLANVLYQPRRNFRTNLHAQVTFPAALGKKAAQFTLNGKGDLADLRITGAGQLPGETQLALHLHGKSAAPKWQLDLTSAGIDPGLLTQAQPGTTPTRLELHATGEGGLAQLRGQLQHADFAATVQPSTLRLHKQTLTLQPLIVDVLEGRIQTDGMVNLQQTDNTAVQLNVQARDLRWANADKSIHIGANADLKISGALDHWQAQGQTRLQRDKDTAQVDLVSTGNRTSLRFDTLHVVMPQGHLDATGNLHWAPQWQWDIATTLEGFDPGYFAPDWPGRLQGNISSQGELTTQGKLRMQLHAQPLSGQLRQRPLQAQAELRIADEDYAGKLDLALGNSRMKAQGHWGNSIAIDSNIAALHLVDVMPNASGQLSGTLKINGTRNAPNIQANISGQQLAFNGYQAQQLSLQGHLPWKNGQGQLALEAHGLQVEQPLDALHLQLQGAVTQLQFDAKAQSAALGNLTTQGKLQQLGNAWQTTISALQFAPHAGSTWALQQPAQARWQPSRITLTPFCLQASVGGQLCAQADWPRNGASLHGQALPLALLADALPKQDNGQPWALVGTVDVQAEVKPSGSSWLGSVHVTSEHGELRQRQRARRSIFAYRNLNIAAALNARTLEAQASAVLDQQGQLEAQVKTGWDATAPLSAALKLKTTSLTWLELFSPDIVDPSGQLDVDIEVSGLRSEPHLAGTGQLQQFAAELPALGIGLQDGNLTLQAQPDGNATITGTARTSNAHENNLLHVDGRLGWLDDDTPLQLSVRGNDVLLADTRQLHLVASPDLQISYRAKTPLQVRGKVGIPEATLHLERLDMAITPSPDVVVVDPIKPSIASALPTDIDLMVNVGEGVHIDGYGLAGTINGNLHVRQPVGRDTRATGALEVGGRYRAYGQDLKITKGKLIWSNSEIADPLLDIQAQREIGDVVAGVKVTGQASAPQANVWSDPAMSQSEALAYLTLGRPLPSLSSREAEQINVAKSALNAGAGLLASQLGKQIGLDDAGVSQSRALGGEVLGVGKYLSPKLYVSYGVSLLGTGQVVTLKYLLRKGFDLQIESSTLENRASVNWRTEK